MFADLHGDEWAYVTDDDGEPTWRPFAQYVSALTWNPLAIRILFQ